MIARRPTRITPHHKPAKHRARPRILVVLAALLAIMAVFAVPVTPAFAVAPETPETTKATGVTASTATLNGVLNPNAPGQPGSYQFSYAPSGTECTPGAFDPEAPAFATGVEKENESVALTGLEPNREYAFCIVAYSLVGVSEPAQGAAVAFMTLASPPGVGSPSVSGATSTGATLEAQVNPNNQETTFVFEYATSKAALGTAGATKLPAGTLSGFGNQTASAPTGVLTPGTPYFYRVIAENAQSKTEGKAVEVSGEFATVATPHTEGATGVTATTAVLHGKLTPLNLAFEAEYSFVYRVGGECNGENGTLPKKAGKGSGNKSVEEAVTGLQPGVLYSVCLVSSNQFGSEVDPSSPPVSFTTLAAAPTIEAASEKASSVTPYEATLEANVNPDNQKTTYVFEYSTSESGGKLSGTIVTLKGENALEGYGDQRASVATGKVLTAGTTYHFRVHAENVAHETVEGAGEFPTPAATAPVIESQTHSGVGTEQARLEATVNPDYQETSCEFQYGTGALLATHTTVRCDPAHLGNGGPGAGASVALTGLQSKTVYYYRVVVTNATGTTTDPTIETFETLSGTAPVFEGPPNVAGESSSEVSLTGATVSVHVNPGGLASTYRVEYGTGGAYASSTSAASLGDASTGVVASAHLSGLEPGTLYQYRFVVSNALGTVTDSESATFTTQAPAPAPETSSCPNESSRQGPSAVLPDCRVYEQVTPVNKGGAEDMFPIVNLVEGAQAGSEGVPSEDGNQYLIDSEAALGEGGGGGKDTYVFSRGVDGWTTTSAVAPGLGVQSVIPELFDPTDLSHIGVLAYLGSLGSETDPERAHDYLVGPAGGPYATVDHRVGEQETVEMVGGSAGLSHVVLATTKQQLAPAISGQDPGVHELYEWAGGQYKLVNVNTGPCGAGLGNGGTGAGGAHNAVSSDGSKIIFTAPDPKVQGGAGCWNGGLVDPPQLYMSVDGTSTVDVSAPAPDAKDSTPYPAVYVGASADGEKVFFLSLGGELTADATGHATELYEYDTLTSKLTRVSRGDSGSAEGKVGIVPAISSDGSAVYFTARGQLAPGAPVGGGLYRYDTNSEVTTYIVSGAEDYGSDCIGCAWYSNTPLALNPKTNWYVTGNGQYLAFVSGQDLTGKASTGSEVYLYSAPNNKLICASCDATGAGQRSDAAFSRSAFVNPSDLAPRPVSENGSYVFFDATDVLVPGAVAGVLHVYEWHDGKISLISGRGDPSASFFLGSSADGSNVFFGTHSQLVAQDADQAGDLYDARVDGGFGGLAPSACTGTGCQGVPGAPPIFATPASVTFAGIGNFASEPPPPKGTVTKKATKCKKGFSKKKGKCVKDKRSKKARKSARKSVHSDRRASR
jgi:hypothetical protein